MNKFFAFLTLFYPLGKYEYWLFFPSWFQPFVKNGANITWVG